MFDNDSSTGNIGTLKYFRHAMYYTLYFNTYFHTQ